MHYAHNQNNFLSMLSKIKQIYHKRYKRGDGVGYVLHTTHSIRIITGVVLFNVAQYTFRDYDIAAGEMGSYTFLKLKAHTRAYT